MMTSHQPVVLDAATPSIQRPRDIDGVLANLRLGVIDAVLATVASIEDFETVLTRLGAWRAWSAESASGVRLAQRVEDIRAAQADGDTAIVLHAQGLNAIGGSLDALETYAALGLRVAQLTYNYRNMLADGCLEPANAGLSEAGRKVVGRLNDRRIVPDISHTGEASSHEIVELSESPVIASHSNARALCDSPRNLTDALIRAVAASGGVIGMNAFPAFVSSGTPSVHDLAGHAAYIAELVGAEHVGMGLDYCDEDDADYDYFGYDERFYPRPPWVWPSGIEDYGQVPNLRAALESIGFSSGEVDGILGENFLRVFHKTWGS
jgi:membrane dipeptidase